MHRAIAKSLNSKAFSLKDRYYSRQMYISFSYLRHELLKTFIMNVKFKSSHLSISRLSGVD